MLGLGPDSGSIPKAIEEKRTPKLPNNSLLKIELKAFTMGFLSARKRKDQSKIQATEIINLSAHLRATKITERQSKIIAISKFN